jgi:methionine sulfoxide reductase heme-binding subunit
MTLWYTARGAGLAALLMLTLATSLGALNSVKIQSAATRVVVQYTHRAAAAIGLGLIALHIGTIVADAKAGVGVHGALVPFAAAYRPNAVALGSIAAYLLVAIAALGLARGRLAASARGAATWRGIHTLAYGAWALAMLHGLTAGTDAGLTWVRTLWATCLVAVFASVAVRLGELARRDVVTGAMR